MTSSSSSSSISSPSIKTLQEFDTIYSADSVEWCPYENYENFFVCGTYELEERETDTDVYNRRGKIYLMQFSCDPNHLDTFDMVDVCETAAILDMKWLRNGNQEPIFGAANSIGEIELYSLADGNLCELSRTKLNPNNSEILSLSLDWSHDGQQLIVSDSKGDLNLYRFNDTGELIKEASWNAHGFEAWTCCFDSQNNNIIYSGGDDTFLNIFDTRSSAGSSRTVVKNKSHSSGVTALLSLPDDNKLITGSYDENLRLFDKRNIKNSIFDINLKGGIWRIKLNPFNKNLILCACMYHNFSIINGNMDTTGTFELIAEYFEHSSICYGADWSCRRHNNLENVYYFSTCSMYDHKLNMSYFEF